MQQSKLTIWTYNWTLDIDQSDKVEYKSCQCVLFGPFANLDPSCCGLCILIPLQQYAQSWPNDCTYNWPIFHCSVTRHQPCFAHGQRGQECNYWQGNGRVIGDGSLRVLFLWTHSQFRITHLTNSSARVHHGASNSQTKSIYISQHRIPPLHTACGV